jgi:hypothetical protein
MNDLYIFLQDCGYRGVLIVIARNEEDARKQMEVNKGINYRPDKPVEKHEIKEGWNWVDYGDA